MHTIWGSSSRLVLAIAAAWGVLVAPAYFAAGEPAVVGLTAAAALCLVPGLVVLVLQFGPLSAWQPLSSLLVAMGLRLVCVLAAVLAVRQLRPDVTAVMFVVWVVPMYLVALAVETQIMMSLTGIRGGRRALSAPACPASSSR